jgi:glycerophosphoryl diester phosphodiesterase
MPGRGGLFAGRPFAHRGLHGPGRPENSLSAARAAIAAGFGIECDVRLSRDGIPFVFHDAGLERLTGARGRFADLDSTAIARLRLRGGDEPPPPLADLLALAAQTPLLIELKSDGGPQACTRLCVAVAAALTDHRGPVGVMSFDPLVCHWFARHCPYVPRGLVLSRRHRHGIMARRTKALAIARARPHFLACDVGDLPKAATRRPGPGRIPLACWTIRTEAQAARAVRHGALLIFE